MPDLPAAACVSNRAVLDVLNSQLDVIVTDGTYFKQRIEQLAAPRRP